VLRISPAVLALLGAAACGDPLLPADYPGTPMMTLNGFISLSTVPVEAKRPILAIQWKWLDPSTRALFASFGPYEPIGMTTLPSTFELDVVDLPPEVVRRSYAVGDRFIDCEVGCPVVFDDLDGNGTHDLDEPLIAISLDQLVVHVEDASGGAMTDSRFQFEDGDRVTSGFHLVEGVCGSSVPNGTLRFIDSGTEVDVRLLDPVTHQMPSVAEGNCTHF
jgi:hypothetical protein